MKRLLHALCTSEFLISTLSFVDILEVTLPISRLLQQPTIDLNRASNAIENNIKTLETKRKNCDTEFSKIFSVARELAELVSVEFKLPRITGRQVHRENYCSSTPKEYFRRCIYIPLLDGICRDMTQRFDNASIQCFGL